MNSNSHGLIDKKAFEEYHEKEKQKTILIYKVILALFIIVNIVFIGFVITYNVQICDIGYYCPQTGNDIESCLFDYFCFHFTAML